MIYVLVHGAITGARALAPVVDRLRGAGHRVLAPALTGVGARAHLAGPEIGLDTHVRDVTAILEYEDLTDAALVGVDYGGVVITAAAEELLGRLSCLIYVAGLVPHDGESTLDLLPRQVRESVRALARDNDGWQVPAGPGFLDLLGVEQAARPAPATRATSFPLRCWEQPARLPTDAAASVERTYVALTATDPRVFGPAAEHALHEGWNYHRVEAGHAVWSLRPDLLVAALLQAAGRVDSVARFPTAPG